MKQYLLILLILLVFLSCHENKTASLIHNNGYKYWQVVDTSSKQSKTLYYFDKNGKWLVFNEYKNREFKIYDGGDVLLNTKWRLVNDSTFDNGLENRIVKISDTIFEFTNQKTGVTHLKKYPDSLVPSLYRKIQ